MADGYLSSASSFAMTRVVGGKDYTRGCPTLEEAAVRAVLLGFESSLGFWATRYECRVSWVEGWWFSNRTRRFTC